MNETPPPYDPTALIPARPPEPDGPSGRTVWRARMRRLVTPMRRFATPMFAGAVALLLAGAVGGYLLGSRGASTSVVSPASEALLSGPDLFGSASFDRAVGFGPGGPGGHGRFGHGGRGAVGTIDSVNGKTITLTTRNGRKITVTAADDVAVTVRSPGSLTDLKPGQPIAVSGQRGSDGSITAQRIAVGASK
ncbi:MAG: DUF5666 domain-containing protein [Pseudonocardiaceae bacterium]